MASETKSPAFGSAFVTHMLQQQYANGAWKPSEIIPYGNFSLPPSSVVFHYGQEIFEGFKAYRQPDNSLALFRPDRNLARMNNSAKRLCMAAIDEKQVLADIIKLVKQVADQVPARPNSLYIRPAMIATDAVIKVNPSANYTFFTIACIVGDYFGGGDPRGVRLRTETEYVRAAPGGTGAAKCGGNYAASLAAQGQAAKDGFDQVVWLDAREHKYIEEMGGMNIMFVLGETLVTPSLESGSILPGVTRESLIALFKAQGGKVEERAISTDELIAANKSGALKECFACGTAAVVTPIREILHKGETLYKNNGDKPGALTTKLRQQLVDIQYGVSPAPAGWLVKVQ
jgi:branched-chain amino acid aminotransferase